LSSATRLLWPLLTRFLLDRPLASLAELAVVLDHERFGDSSAPLADHRESSSLKVSAADC
jgi:hypothetical protein